MDYEVIIIGCGPAGLSAGIYLGRAQVKTLLVGKHKESQLTKAHKIENYFGFPKGIKGSELLKLGIQQAKKFKVKLINDEVVEAKTVTGGFSLKTGSETTYTAKALVIATGTPIRLSGIQNEEKLTGKGVHYCVECDGAFYKNKTLIVIGNGNHAAESALDLQIFTKNVTIVSNAPHFEFSPEMKKELEKDKITLVNKKVREFTGKKFLERITFDDGTSLPCDGVFMACGVASALDFASELGLKITANILEVDNENTTNIPGIFAAGNCAGKCRQVARNVGEGCTAGLGAIKYLRNQKVYFDYSR